MEPYSLRGEGLRGFGKNLKKRVDLVQPARYISKALEAGAGYTGTGSSENLDKRIV